MKLTARNIFQGVGFKWPTISASPGVDLGQQSRIITHKPRNTTTAFNSWRWWNNLNKRHSSINKFEQFSNFYFIYLFFVPGFKLILRPLDSTRGSRNTSAVNLVMFNWRLMTSLTKNPDINEERNMLNSRFKTFLTLIHLKTNVDAYLQEQLLHSRHQHLNTKLLLETEPVILDWEVE